MKISHKEAIPQHIKDYIKETIRKEIDRDPKLDQFAKTMFQIVGFSPDETEGLTALQAYDAAMYHIRNENAKDSLNNLAAPYFFNMLRKLNIK